MLQAQPSAARCNMRVVRVELDHAWTDAFQKQDARLNAVWGNVLLYKQSLIDF